MSLLVLLLALAQAAAPPPAEGQRPALTIHTADAPGARVFYLNIPWGPETFATMARPADSFYNLRTWPFARLEAQKPLTFQGVPLPPGNYALLFHPNTPDDKGMSLELRKVRPGEFLEPGNVMARPPEGETIWRAPVRFDTAAGTSPDLKIDVLPGKGGFQLKVQYGDHWTTTDFHY